MQFLVFVAFAVVLSVPEGGPPWKRLTSPGLSVAIAIGQIVLVALVCRIYTDRVRSRLERDPAWLPGAQRRLTRGNTAHRTLLFLGLVTSIYGTDWVPLVRKWVHPWPFWGLDEIIVLLPFFASILVGWIMLYPADRAVRQVALELRLWSAAPVRPVWTLRQFLSFNLRQHVFIIVLPMVPIVVANDFAVRYSNTLRRATGIAWADQAVLVIVSGFVFFFAPLILRYVWHTRVLPAGELRSRLEELCRRIGLTYRNILIWESDGMVVNAAVMGLLRPVRYILLSDGLLEMMDDQKIEAVFGHEAGHVKKRHIEFYLLFAICSMLLVGGVFEIVQYAARRWPEFWPHRALLQDYMQVTAMGLIVVVWALGFGVVSRRFEWQADLFGCRSVTPPSDQCDQPCILHGTAAVSPAAAPGPWLTPAASPQSTPPINRGPSPEPVCATAAGMFADALHRIAVLNGIPIEARSWRHSSIGNRMRLLQTYARDPLASSQLEKAVAIIKVVLLLGTIAGLAIGLWLYWPTGR